MSFCEYPSHAVDGCRNPIPNHRLDVFWKLVIHGINYQPQLVSHQQCFIYSWWFQMFLIFTSKFGEMIQFDVFCKNNFSNFVDYIVLTSAYPPNKIYPRMLAGEKNKSALTVTVTLTPLFSVFLLGGGDPKIPNLQWIRCGFWGWIQSSENLMTTHWWKKAFWKWWNLTRNRDFCGFFRMWRFECESLVLVQYKLCLSYLLKKIRLVVCIFSLAILVSDLQKTLMALGPLSHAYSNKLPRWIMVRDCWRCLYFKWSRFTRTDERYMWPTDPNFRRRRRRWGYGVGKESDWKVDSSLWFFQIDGQKVGCIILDSYS